MAYPETVDLAKTLMTILLSDEPVIFSNAVLACSNNLRYHASHLGYVRSSVTWLAYRICCVLPSCNFLAVVHAASHTAAAR